MAVEINRREFMIATAAAGAIASLPALAQTSPPPVPEKPLPPRQSAHFVDAHFKVNGKDYALKIDTRTTLLDLLREHLDLTGSKKGCDHGQCGACTVLVNGNRINSCLSLAVQNQGKDILTIEGLAKEDQLDPLQEAFIKCDAFQCGFCTPGQIMSAKALLKEPCGSKDDDVRESMSGNICRCGAYPNIVAAIQEVRGHHATV
jgi:xanthine dehydrogenase YagT iron-sulfur-binding subunit